MTTDVVYMSPDSIRIRTAFDSGPFSETIVARNFMDLWIDHIRYTIKASERLVYESRKQGERKPTGCEEVFRKGKAQNACDKRGQPVVIEERHLLREGRLSIDKHHTAS
ncbi:hypothetical protein H0H81_009813 [Sphagnurus paluster]|uniref:Uncharacterized protein n=1 Tax=Sphagnurus paluster TaxID=117069 RepID=A0A9P7K2R1_9AGAR|nr:hypothetical protein H0H81_009813 [Sphagnurus paluster]